MNCQQKRENEIFENIIHWSPNSGFAVWEFVGKINDIYLSWYINIYIDMKNLINSRANCIPTLLDQITPKTVFIISTKKKLQKFKSLNYHKINTRDPFIKVFKVVVSYLFSHYFIYFFLSYLFSNFGSKLTGQTE